MGKKSKKPSGGGNSDASVKDRLQKKLFSKKDKPFVSICTPTYNRRPFIQSMFACFLHQDYPRELMEWIIIDDGTDPIEDLIKESGIPEIKYFKYKDKMPLGKKRNIMHEKSKGDIIVYMDDDDYYPPQRVSHAVHMLVTHPNALCAGSSEIFIWFKHLQQMIKFGPYGPNHATAGTFAFKRELLNDHKYNEKAALAEEKEFLKNYTVPFVQLEPKKVILVFSHEHNTFDKRKLLENRNPQFVHDTDVTVDDFVKEPVLKKFFMDELEDLLVDYKPGEPSMKPDVLQQIIKIEEQRRKHLESTMQAPLMYQEPGKPPQQLKTEQIMQILNQQKQHLAKLNNILQDRDREINSLKEKFNTEEEKGFLKSITNDETQPEIQKQENLSPEEAEFLKSINADVPQTQNISQEVLENQQIPNQQNIPQIMMQEPGQEPRPMSPEEIIHLLNSLQEQVQLKNQEINSLKQPNNIEGNNENLSVEEAEFLKSIGADVPQTQEAISTQQIPTQQIPAQQNIPQIMKQIPGQPPIPMTIEEISQLMNNMQQQLQVKQQEINSLAQVNSFEGAEELRKAYMSLEQKYKEDSHKSHVMISKQQETIYDSFLLYQGLLRLVPSIHKMLENTEEKEAINTKSLIETLPEKRENINKEITEHLDKLKTIDEKNMKQKITTENITLEIS
jgi:hypothetical protein